MTPAKAYAHRQLILSSADALQQAAKQTTRKSANKLDIAAFNKAYAMHDMLKASATGNRADDAVNNFLKFDISGAEPQEILLKAKAMTRSLDRDPRLWDVLEDVADKAGLRNKKSAAKMEDIFSLEGGTQKEVLTRAGHIVALINSHPLLIKGVRDSLSAMDERLLKSGVKDEALATGDKRTLLSNFDLSGTDPTSIVKKAQAIIEGITWDPHLSRVVRQALSEMENPEVVAKAMRVSLPMKVHGVVFENFSNAVLAGMETQGVNIGSNLINLAWTPTESMMRFVMASARRDWRAAIGEGVETIARVQGMALGFQDAFRYLSRNVSGSNKGISRTLGSLADDPGTITFAREKPQGLDKLGDVNQPKIGNSLEELGIPRHLSGTSEIEQQRARRKISSEYLNAHGWVADFVNFMGPLIRIPGAALVEADIGFKIIHYRMETGARAVRDAMNTPGTHADKRSIFAQRRQFPTKQAQQESIDAARLYTFTAELGDKGGKQGRAVLDKVPVLQYWVPFFNTPTNIVKLGTRNSMIGNLYYDLIPALPGGHSTPAQKDVARAKIAMGTASTLAVVSILNNDITGRIDKSTPEGRYKDEFGPPEYSIKMGQITAEDVDKANKYTDRPNVLVVGQDVYYSYAKLEPLRSILGLIVNYRDAIRNLKTIVPYGSQAGKAVDVAAQLATITVAPLANTIGDQYMLRTLTGFMDLVESIQTAGKEGNVDVFIRKMEDFAVAMTPFSGFMKQGNKQIFDKHYRAAEGYMDKMHKMIPNLSPDLPPVYTIWGDPQFYPDGLGPDWVSPVRTIVKEGDYVDEEVIRLEVQIPSTPKEIVHEGVTLELTPEQGAKVALWRGKGFAHGAPPLKDKIKNIVDTTTFGVADNERREMITEAMNNAHTAAVKYLFATDKSLQKQWFENLDQRLKQEAKSRILPGQTPLVQLPNTGRELK